MRRAAAWVMVALLCACGAKATGGKGNVAADGAPQDSVVNEGSGVAMYGAFSADSAMQALRRQVEFGARVPGTAAHRATADWLAAELRRHGATVTEQTASLKAFDGTALPMRNIFAQYNPGVSDRTLLLAHYDTRPWADEDSDPANRRQPVPGANDGASGVAVLLEAARLIGAANPGNGIDILFVDCEDYGTDGDDSSWALGAEYFVKHPPVDGYAPSRAILLDMVGGKDAIFPAEYFSRQAAPDLDDAWRAAATRIGEGDRFPRVYGGAVTDDHVKLIAGGIPAIDIIEYDPREGFNPTWHTLDDTPENIDPATLGAVGRTLMEYLSSLAPSPQSLNY